MNQGLRMLFPLVAIILLEVSARWCVDAVDSDQELDYYKRLYDFGLGKRAAYSYVSEYKRLPVYNFGLGKRSGGDARKLYSFGLGKRDYDSEEDYEDDLKEDYAKRMKQYSFGLGKRLPTYKRPEGKMYSFGLGKRSPYDDYDTMDETKRTSGQRFSFGLGKRDDRAARSMHYNFGLGKRDQQSSP